MNELTKNLISDYIFFDFPLLILKKKSLNNIDIGNTISKDLNLRDIWNCFRAHLKHELPYFEKICQTCFRYPVIYKTDLILGRDQIIANMIKTSLTINESDKIIEFMYKNRNIKNFLLCENCIKETESITIDFKVKKRKTETYEKKRSKKNLN